MTDSERPTHFRIDIADLSQEAGAALASQFLGPGFSIGPSLDGRLDVAAEFWPLDGMTASRNEHLNAHVSRESNSQPTGFIRLRLILGGRMLGAIDEDHFDLHAGALVFDGDSAAGDFQFEDFSCLALKIPNEAVHYDSADHPPFVLLSQDDPEGALLADAIRTFFDQLAHADRATADRLVKVIIGLTRGFVSSLPAKSSGSGANRPDKLQDMCAFLDVNLDEPKLGVKHLVQEFHASRAAVYRHFSDFGGVNRYLAEKRLHRAMRLLTLRSDAYPRIADVAAAVGFSDQHHFSRAFRQRFGISPSEARQTLESQREPVDDDALEATRLAEHYRTILQRSEGGSTPDPTQRNR